MKCRSCGYEFDPKFGICPRCGNAAEYEMTVCPECGNVFSEEFEVCPACGHICVSVPGEVPGRAAQKAMDVVSVFGPSTELPKYSDQNASAEAVSSAAEGVSAPAAGGVKAEAGTGFAAVPEAEYAGGLLDRSEVLLDEKVSAFKFSNAYRIYSPDGELIGAVQQNKVSGGAKAARLLLGSGTKSFQKFRYDILDAEGTVLASVIRDGGALSQIRIEDASGNVVGAFVRGQVVSPSGEVLCKVKSDWKLWNITMIDAAGNTVGEIHKRWNGIAKEIFTSADKYHIVIYPQLSGNARTAVFVTAVVYDMLLHER